MLPGTRKGKNDLFATQVHVRQLDAPPQNHHQAVARFPAAVDDVSLGILAQLTPFHQRIEGRDRKPAQEGIRFEETANVLGVREMSTHIRLAIAALRLGWETKKSPRAMHGYHPGPRFAT
jgi:hypothetical protein